MGLYNTPPGTSNFSARPFRVSTGFNPVCIISSVSPKQAMGLTIGNLLFVCTKFSGPKALSFFLVLLAPHFQSKNYKTVSNKHNRFLIWAILQPFLPGSNKLETTNRFQVPSKRKFLTKNLMRLAPDISRQTSPFHHHDH